MTILTFIKWIRIVYDRLLLNNYNEENIKVVITYIALWVSNMTNSNTSFCRWIPQNQQMGSTYSRNAISMVWDFTEINPFGNASGNSEEYFKCLFFCWF